MAIFNSYVSLPEGTQGFLQMSYIRFYAYCLMRLSRLAIAAPRICNAPWVATDMDMDGTRSTHVLLENHHLELRYPLVNVSITMENHHL